MALVIAMLVGNFNCSAQTDVFDSQSYKEYLSEETVEILEKYQIDAPLTGEQDNFTAYDVFREIFSFFKTGFREPFWLALKLIGVIILSALLKAYASSGTLFACESVCRITFVSLISLPLYGLISSAASVLKAVSVFTASFAPVCISVLSASGKTFTAAASNSVVLAAAGAVSAVASFVVVPLLSAYLALSICSYFSPGVIPPKLLSGMKTAAMWIFSFCVTVFLAVLGIKGTIACAADGVGVKTVKFLLGSFVPVAGSALSSTLSTVLGSLSLLKGTLTVYAVIGVAVTLLPLIVQIICYKAALFCVNAVGTVFLQDTTVTEVFGGFLSVLLGFLIFSGALFIICFGTVAAF